METTFIVVLKSTCYDYCPSLKSFTVFFAMDLLLGYVKAFPLEMGGGYMGKSTYALGGGGL